MSDPMKDVGVYRGRCSRMACRRTPAEWYNHSTRQYYCRDCARELNEFRPEEAQRLFGHELCTEGQPSVHISNTSAEKSLYVGGGPEGVVEIPPGESESFPLDNKKSPEPKPGA